MNMKVWISDNKIEHTSKLQIFILTELNWKEGNYHETYY